MAHGDKLIELLNELKEMANGMTEPDPDPWKLPIKCTHCNYFMFTLSDVIVPIMGFAMYKWDDPSIIIVSVDGTEYELSKPLFFTEFERAIAGQGDILPPNHVTEFHWIGDNNLHMHEKVYNTDE